MGSLGRMGTCCAGLLSMLCFGIVLATIMGQSWTVLLGLRVSGFDPAIDNEVDAEAAYLGFKPDQAPPHQTNKRHIEPIDDLSLVPCNAPAEDMSDHEKAGPWARGRQRDMSAAWQEYHVQRNKGVHKQKYCIAQCGLDKCCEPRGWRTGTSWMRTIKDDLAPPRKDNGFSDITLVTQGSFDRLDIFSMIADAWPGPKVALFAIYNHTDAHHQSAERQLFDISEAAEDWHNVKVLAYVVEWNRDYYSKRMTASNPILPLNTFRNIVIDAAHTNFVFTVDMDFVPSHTLYPKFTKYLLPLVASIDRAVIVIPHWEALTCYNEIRIPRDFVQLSSYSKQGKARPFHADTELLISLDEASPPQDELCMAESKATWTAGIQTTNYHRWFEESLKGIDGFYPLNVAGPMYDKFYEPFTIVRRVESNGFLLPRYEEKYVGRYKNKISFVTQMRGFQYQFFALRQEFLIHVPHPTANTTDPAMKEHLFNMRQLNKQDRESLQKIYNNPELTMPKLRKSPFDKGVECKFDI